MRAFLLLSAVFCTVTLPLGCTSGSSSRRTVEAEPLLVGRTGLAESEPAVPTEFDAAAARSTAQVFLFLSHLRSQPQETEARRKADGDWEFYRMPGCVTLPDGTGYAYNYDPFGGILSWTISPSGATAFQGDATEETRFKPVGPVNWCGLQDDPRAALFIGRAIGQSARLSFYDFVQEQELGEKGWLFQVVECYYHDPGEPAPDCVQSVVLVNRQGECGLVFTSPQSDRELLHQKVEDPIVIGASGTEEGDGTDTDQR